MAIVVDRFFGLTGGIPSAQDLCFRNKTEDTSQCPASASISPSDTISCLLTNWRPFPEGRIQRLLNGPGATLMLGAGFLALRVQVDAAEEFGKRVRA